jgi:PAS domain S-box-containing protein
LEKSMADKVESYRSLFERNSDGVFLLDQAGHFLAVNAAAERISGFSAQDVKGKTFRDLCAADQLEACEQAFQRALEGEMHELETAIILKDGQRKEVLVTGGPITIDGSVGGLFLFVKDITERKKAEKERESVREALEARIQEGTEKLRSAEKSLDESAQHLRLLASQLTSAEQREREKVARILHDDLQQVLVAAKFQISESWRSIKAEEAAAIASELIDHAIAITRSLTVELSPPILRQGNIVQVMKWLAGWMKEKYGFVMEITSEERMKPLSYELVVFLFQAVRELLLNVLKHANIKTARVDLSMLRNRIRIMVQDNGAGFEPNQLRAESDPAGFGLLTIRERVRSFGGRLVVSSTPGHGSRLILIVPVSGAQRQRSSDIALNK